MNRDAAEYLDYCLRHYPASSRPESVATEQRARAAFEVVKTKVAAVNVRVTPVGAEVYVDGTIAGRAPLDAPVFLEAGPHRIEARYAGLESASVDVNAKRGESIETVIEPVIYAGPRKIRSSFRGAGMTRSERRAAASTASRRQLLHSWATRSSAWEMPFNEYVSVVLVPWVDTLLMTSSAPLRMASTICASSAAFLTQAPSFWVYMS